MSTDPDIRREQQIADEAEEDRDAELREWVRRSNDYLWAQCADLVPWVDAGPAGKSSSGEK